MSNGYKIPSGMDSLTDTSIYNIPKGETRHEETQSTIHIPSWQTQAVKKLFNLLCTDMSPPFLPALYSQWYLGYSPSSMHFTLYNIGRYFSFLL